ncbi:MAG: hypothetical protein QNJ67_09640 [Kiloniellales bacterium]|nr:hypothetical protein [Kiloniellales bacterium]
MLRGLSGFFQDMRALNEWLGVFQEKHSLSYTLFLGVVAALPVLVYRQIE